MEDGAANAKGDNRTLGQSPEVGAKPRKGETMAIQSDAFSRVALTGDDAKKFMRQVTYGRPKASAKENVARGADMVKQYQTNGGHFVFKASVKK